MAGELTITEIREQPEVLSRLLDAERTHILALAAKLRRPRPSAVFLAARGTSDNAALYGHYLFETMLGIPSGLASPSVVTIYRKIPRLRGTLVLGLSQSGRSADIVRYLEAARAAGARTVALTNDEQSPLARAAHDTLLLHAGLERSVAATKTYTAQLTLLSLLVAAIAGDRKLLDDHNGLPRMVERVLDDEDSVRPLSRWLSGVHQCIITARGYNFATAREAALKLKETAHIAAEALSAADLLHGPIAVVGPRFPVIIVAPPGAPRAHLARVGRRLAAQGARIMAVTSAAGFDGARHLLRIPARIAEVLTPHVYIVPLQLLAYHLSLTRGYDPDRPRGLHKVTSVL